MKIPDIVFVALKQLAKIRSTSAIADNVLEEKFRRLCAEELEPRGMFLLVRKLPDGRIRFIIKDCASNSTVEILECA